MSQFIQNIAICGKDLLPAFEKIDQAKALNLSLIITEIAKKSLLSFLEGKLAAFDAAVGDNSCKIRAVKIALIDRSTYKEEVSLLLDRLEIILERIRKIQIKKENCRLQEFRSQHNIEFPLSEDLAFLIRSYFLCFVKKQGAYDQTDPSCLQQLGDIAKSCAKDWIHCMKQQLAETSVHFVRSAAEKIDSSRKEILQKMVTEPFVKRHDKRPILPNLHSMEILFTTALQKDLRLIFKNPEGPILFHSNRDKTSFIPKKVEEDDLGLPAIIIEGKLDKRIPFDENDFFLLLLTRASQDPQYLDGVQSSEIPFDTETLQEQERMDLTKKIPLPFQIDHILCGKVGHYFFIPKEQQTWHSCNWMGDDLNVQPGAWRKQNRRFSFF